MKKLKLSRAIGLTSAALAMGFAVSPASAVEFDAGDVNVDLYGHARLNAVYDIDQDIGLNTQSGHFPYLFTNDNGRDGHFDADAQQSRLGVTATHENGMSVTVEGDFRGGDLRLLRAYGEYGNWMAGRNWSNYTSFVGWTPTLDFDGLAGLAGVQDRAAQVRYTTGPWSFSLEDPRFQNVGGDEKQSAPVVTARYENALTSSVMFSAGALLQYLSYDEGDAGDDDNAVGMAGYVATDVSVTDAVTLHGVLSATDGANGYLYRSGDSGFGGQDAYRDGSSLETIQGYGGTVGVSADAGAGTMNVGYGLVKMDWDDYESDVGAVAADGRVETNSNAFVNYQWYPIENVMLGVEYGYFKSELYDGDSENAQRVMFASQYSF
ncbi:hypothetical protein [Marinobacter zhanjiangensis]|uniref:Porin n=1 Tax=Marinobacter zhanjiangensis TaxID=578215 RepID=A0ABQ3BA30_9GAMM|nr:hypothetical protein [Marinobacter zhanjiangensis]GGY80467.1 hypothetical protein GCM10007071_29740 [Marinobacter zhanjiangensis]